MSVGKESKELFLQFVICSNWCGSIMKQYTMVIDTMSVNVAADAKIQMYYFMVSASFDITCISVCVCVCVCVSITNIVSAINR